MDVEGVIPPRDLVSLGKYSTTHIRVLLSKRWASLHEVPYKDIFAVPQDVAAGYRACAHVRFKI